MIRQDNIFFSKCETQEDVIPANTSVTVDALSLLSGKTPTVTTLTEGGLNMTMFKFCRTVLRNEMPRTHMNHIHIFWILIKISVDEEHDVQKDENLFAYQRQKNK